MTTIKEVNEHMDQLLNEIEQEGVLEEVKAAYEPYNKNMHLLLDVEDLESYLEKYEEMHEEDSAILKCFNSDTTEELTNIITERNISFDDLKTETALASCEALKFIIYDCEEEGDDDY